MREREREKDNRKNRMKAKTLEINVRLTLNVHLTKDMIQIEMLHYYLAKYLNSICLL